jgi:hypothetical protein
VRLFYVKVILSYINSFKYVFSGVSMRGSSIYVGAKPVLGDSEANFAFDNYMKHKEYGLSGNNSFAESSFVDNFNLYSDFVRYADLDLGDFGNLTNFFVYDAKKKVAIGSNPRLAIAFNMFCEHENLEYQIATPAQTEELKRHSYDEKFYVNTALVLRSFGNNELVNDLCYQISDRYPDSFDVDSSFFKIPFVIPLRSLDLISSNGYFNLKESFEEDIFQSNIFSRESGNFSDEEVNWKGVPDKLFEYGDRFFENDYDEPFSSLSWSYPGDLNSNKGFMTISRSNGRIFLVRK